LIGLFSGCEALDKALEPQADLASSQNMAANYEQIVVPVFSPASGLPGKCIDCHTSSGSEASLPFADSNGGVAYPAGMQVINLTDPASSVLMQYLSNNHCSSAECQVASGSAIYQTFLSALQNFAQAAHSPAPSASPVPGGPTPMPSPTVSATALGGVVTGTVPFPSNPPLLGTAPIVLSVPLAAVNAAFGTSAIQLNVNYTQTGTSPTTGKLEYLYDLSNPVLANATAATTISIGGLYFAVNGLVTIDSNILSNPSVYKATAAPGTSVSLIPAGALGSVRVWASPGDSLSIVVLQSSTGAVAGVAPKAASGLAPASAVCGTGLTGAITASSAAGPLPGVAQYGCASMATIPPYNGPDPSSGGSGQTFSFKATAPAALGPATLNGAISVVVMAAQAPGTYDLSDTSAGYIQYGYLNSSYCATPTGTITVTALTRNTGTGSFTASGLCDMNGTVQYSGISGTFHIP
jgi:hypothetical protein